MNLIFIKDFYTESLKEEDKITIEVTASSEVEGPGHRILSMKGNLSDVFPTVPLPDFNDGPQKWREIMKSLDIKNREPFIYGTTGISGEYINLVRAIELGYELKFE